MAAKNDLHKNNYSPTPSGEEYSRVFRWKRGMAAINHKRSKKELQKAAGILGVV
jgi:hypothetical protein